MTTYGVIELVKHCYRLWLDSSKPLPNIEISTSPWKLIGGPVDVHIETCLSNCRYCIYTRPKLGQHHTCRWSKTDLPNRNAMVDVIYWVSVVSNKFCPNFRPTSRKIEKSQRLIYRSPFNKWHFSYWKVPFHCKKDETTLVREFIHVIIFRVHSE